MAPLSAEVFAGLLPPDYNPIEQLWPRLRAYWFWEYIADTPEELFDRLCTALKSFIDHLIQTASICPIGNEFWQRL